MREDDFYQPLVDLAKLFGWRIHHQRPAQNRSGKWSSAILGDPGFPDFMFSHPTGLLVIREIKGPRTTVTDDQSAWLTTLVSSGVDAGVWRMPDAWPDAVATLTFGRGDLQGFPTPDV
jgi:hypothetical protein